MIQLVGVGVERKVENSQRNSQRSIFEIQFHADYTDCVLVSASLVSICSLIREADGSLSFISILNPKSYSL